ncbi:MAG: hypothetical protein JWN52_3438 [Actinomycetia bacterium]|jgi:hypothetical protein|nr:hypothetical protein [Actinomycetes bacterium]
MTTVTDKAADTTAALTPSSTPAPTRLLPIAELTEILARLDRSVTGAEDGPPEVTALHLTRVLVPPPDAPLFCSRSTLTQL